MVSVSLPPAPTQGRAHVTLFLRTNDDFHAFLPVRRPDFLQMGVRSAPSSRKEEEVALLLVRGRRYLPQALPDALPNDRAAGLALPFLSLVEYGLSCDNGAQWPLLRTG